jgi:hypothetical protein
MAAYGLAQRVTSDPCVQLAHGSQTTQELNPHKKEVSSNGLTGQLRARVWNPGRLLVNKTPRFAQHQP